MDGAAELPESAGQPHVPRASTQAEWVAPFLAGVFLVAALGLLAAGLTAGRQPIDADAIHPGVRVGNVPVGGMTREQAVSELSPLLTAQVARSLLLRLEGTEREARLSELGAAFDVTATVDEAYAVGRSGAWRDRLADRFRELTSGYSIEEPGLRVDRSKLETYLRERARQFDRQVRDAELVIGQDASVRVVPSIVGRRLDVDGAAAAMEHAVAAGTAAVELPVVETPPGRVERDLEGARAALATMLSGPVALEFEARRWTLGVKEIVSIAAVEQKPGTLAPVVSLREVPLKRMVDRIAAEIDQPVTNARLDWNGGNLRVLRSGQDGRKLDRDRALEALKGAITGDRRVVSLPVEVKRAVGGSLDPSKAGIKELIEVGRTPLVGVPEKVHNIKLAASRLNGVVVPPGEVFSFNRELVGHAAINW